MNPDYHRSQARPTFRNPRGVVFAMIAGAAVWVCACGALAALWSLAH